MTKQGKVNKLGFTRQDYKGGKSTLCAGCGHDSITNHIVSALFHSGINPYEVAKMSGIGCSSKTPTYFLSLSHGFNAIHGRMAPVATGAKLANQKLSMIGVSGDGDTASIGLGSFIHMIRRNLPIVYIVENNGVYGLTKGQFSATADPGSTLKNGEQNPFESIDLCSMAIDQGCGFVARSFSGDAKQLVPLIQAAFRHPGTAVIDVISPCVAFADHEGSTKSYNAVRENLVSLQEMGFIEPQEEIEVDYEEGQSREVELHDGSVLWLKKLNSQEHDISDPKSALNALHEARHNGAILTGLFYYDKNKENLNNTLQLSETPLSELNASETRPSPEVLNKLMATFK